MEKICLRYDDGNWCWLNHCGMYNWDNDDYEVIEVDADTVEDVDKYLATYEKKSNKV